MSFYAAFSDYISVDEHLLEKRLKMLVWTESVLKRKLHLQIYPEDVALKSSFWALAYQAATHYNWICPTTATLQTENSTSHCSCIKPPNSLPFIKALVLWMFCVLIAQKLHSSLIALKCVHCATFCILKTIKNLL